MRLFHRRFRSLPTPMAGLALGVASLGWCMENALPLHGYGQIVGAVIASCLLGLLVVRFIWALRGYVWVEPCHHAPTGRFGNGMSTLEQMSRM